MKIIVLFGPPGVGKGTQASLISDKFNLKIISTGALIRKNMDKDINLSQLVSQGKYASDQLVSSLVKDELMRCEYFDGFILDGYPRTELQAVFLDNIVLADKNNGLYFISLELAETVLIDRLASRLTCKDCNAAYNIKTSPPKQDNICDHCRGKNLFIRSDDNPASIKVRLEAYKNKTQKIIKYYQGRKNFINIIANGSVDKINQDICNFLQ